MVLTSEEDDECDDVGVVGNEFAIEVCKAKEGAYSLDQGRGMPVPNGREFCRVHVNKALTNNHSQVFHGRSIEGALRDFERKTVFPDARKDSMSLLVM